MTPNGCEATAGLSETDLIPLKSSKRDAAEMRIFHAGIVAMEVLHLKEIAECFGVQSRLVDVERSPSLLIALREEIAKGSSGLALDLSSLKAYLDAPEQLLEMTSLLRGSNTTVLLLATDSDQISNQVVETLTEGEVLQVSERTRADTVNFPESGSSFSRELSSQTFPRGAKRALTLSGPAEAAVDMVMALSGLPSFVHRPLGEASIFVWSTPHVFDVRRRLRAEKEFEIACDEYIPAIIFLRAAFRDQCWHNPGAGAGVVIDDPLLQRKYGFIDFEKLLKSARSHRYHVTLAFIPWNQWRSRSKEMQLFLNHSDCFSICVHGCDHTRNEYGLADYDGLLRKNFVARDRMDRHGRRTGLETEPLMVCPQEKYSMEAMEAFSDSRQFLGLVCTACMPRNLISPQICGADLLLPAQDSLFGFPVFKRHYWGGMAVFAMALFLGKPAILVEHHEFFRNGPAGAEEFAQRLAELRPDLAWRSLAETITRTHARRRVSDGYEVRFFTDRFILEHQLEAPINYRLFRRVPNAAAVERVLIGDQQVPFSRQNGFVVFETQLHRPDSLLVQVKVTPVMPSQPYPNRIRYQTAVAFRRGLSELRDNIIARNRFALKTGRLLMGIVKHTERSRNNSAHRG
jgi:hypothetical protein